MIRACCVGLVLVVASVAIASEEIRHEGELDGRGDPNLTFRLTGNPGSWTLHNLVIVGVPMKCSDGIDRGSDLFRFGTTRAGGDNAFVRRSGGESGGGEIRLKIEGKITRRGAKASGTVRSKKVFAIAEPDTVCRSGRLRWTTSAVPPAD